MEIVSREDARASGLKFFFTGKSCKNGHLSERYTSNGICAECAATRVRPSDQSRWGAWREKNKEKVDASRKTWEIQNRERLRQYQALYRQENREKLRDQQKTRKIQYRKNPLFCLKESVASLIRLSLICRGYSKNSKTCEILGCSWSEFAAHIERQFMPNMNWDNRYLWHIDHIIPLATAKTEADVLALNHVSNLRPMWGKENIQKSDKILFLI